MPKEIFVAYQLDNVKSRVRTFSVLKTALKSFPGTLFSTIKMKKTLNGSYTSVINTYSVCICMQSYT